jgi:hypothetical protein
MRFPARNIRAVKAVSIWIGSFLLAAFLQSSPTQLASGQDFKKSLESLKKIDDFPLYVMRFVGDYAFKEQLKKGGRPEAHTRPVLPKKLAAWACSCFSISNGQGQAIFGRNFDWFGHPALLLFTDPPEGYASVSMVDLSYLGYGRGDLFKKDLGRLRETPYFPFDGMNEHGLAVGMMAVPHAEGGTDPGKTTIDDLQAIRLMLDYAKNVKEAATLLGGYNVSFGSGPPVHYFVADAAGDSAAIEFIDHRMQVLRNKRRFQMATNFILFPIPPQNCRTSCWRYNKIYETLSHAQNGFSPAEAMSLLKNVSQSGTNTPTIWSMVYDLAAKNIHVAMGRNYGQVHLLSLR